MIYTKPELIFLLQTYIQYKKYSRKCSVITPNRKKTVASLSRKNFRAASSGFVNLQGAKPHIIAQVHYQKCGHHIVCSIRVFKMDFHVIKLSHCSLSLKY